MKENIIKLDKKQVPIDFVSIVDTGYLQPMKVSVQQAVFYYPDCKYYIYDIGLTPEEKDELIAFSKNVFIVDWKLLFTPLQQTYSTKTLLIKLLGVARDVFTNSSKTINQLYRRYDLEIIYLNKIYVLLHYFKKFNTGNNVVYLDADAFLLNEIDELFATSEVNVYITRRRETELSYKYNNCKLLNAGVLIFTKDHHQNVLFLKEWKTRAENSREYLVEQSSLSRMLLEKNEYFLLKL